MYKAVIFDLDGTLLNTIEDLANACNYALKINRYKEYEINDYKKFVGNGARILIQRILPEEERSEENIDKLLKDFDFYYGKHMQDNTRPYEGIIDLLDELNSCGIQTAVVSNKPHKFTGDIVRKYFGDRFKFIYGKREGYNIKPDPVTVLEVIDKMKLNKEDILYVGDSNVDMHTAKNAKVKAAGVAWGFRSIDELREAGADFIVNDTEELKKVIFN